MGTASKATTGRMAALIKARRIGLGMTQDQLSLAIGSSYGYVSLLERGGVAFPKTKMVVLANALQISVLQLAAAGDISLQDLLDAGVTINTPVVVMEDEPASAMEPEDILINEEPMPEPIIETPFAEPTPIVAIHPRWTDRAYIQAIESQVA